MVANTVRTRFAPSPTGYLHIGGLRTALYAYALAKHYGGQFILRIEDTDQKREVAGSAEKIYDILKKFGLLWDEGPFVQSERVKTGIYADAAKSLVDSGHAFYCFCIAQTKEEIKASRQNKINFRDPCHNLTSEEIKTKINSGQKPAIRLKVPDGEIISYTDYVSGKKTTWKTDVVDDAMLLKSDGFPTYHLAVVVDDHHMQITHALRGHNWMPSTPIHLLLYKYLGFNLPQLGHLTDILDPNGGKLSKRKGNVSVEQFLSDGYLPAALLNFVALLGWAPKDNQEMFTLKEFVDKFDENGFQKSNPQLNLVKLDWFNGQYIRLTSDTELLELLKPYHSFDCPDEKLLQIISLSKSRISNLKDFAILNGFFFSRPSNPPLIESDKKYLLMAKEVLSTVEFDKQSIESSLVSKVKENSWTNSEFFMALRLAIAGQRISPPLTESMIILGRSEVLDRLNQIIK